MNRLLRAVLLAFVTLPGVAYAGEPTPAVPEPELAEIRGGFALPGGGNLSIGVVTDTVLNGVLVVRSAYTVDRGAPSVQVSGRTDGAPLTDLALADGQTVATADGSVTLVRSGDGAQVRFSGDRIDVTALAGRNYGTIVQNSGNDRTIGVSTNIDLHLSGVARDAIGSVAARASTLALDATMTRLSR